MKKLREYSCFMYFQIASPELAAEVLALGSRYRFGHLLTPPRGSAASHIGTWWLEFDFSGSDSERHRVRFLLELAALIGEADGEMRCGWYDDEADGNGDERFEFYRIAGGRLIYQSGRIERGAERTVTFDPYWCPEAEFPD